jgi:hypothetical protein
MSDGTEASDQSIVMRLRTQGAGKLVWRVQDKDDKSYCIQFEAWEQSQAMQWWADNKHRKFHKNHELVKVLVHSSDDRLMQEAADMLDFFFGQMQMYLPKMDGQHKYRFRSDWPMTHCKGPNAEDAVKSAIQEFKRAQSQSA